MQKVANCCRGAPKQIRLERLIYAEKALKSEHGLELFRLIVEKGENLSASTR